LAFDITKVPKKTSSRVASQLLYPNQYGEELFPESNFTSLLRAYKGWVYSCSSKNATAVASTPLRLYVGKPNTDTIRSHRTVKVDSDKVEYLKSIPSLANLPQVKLAAEIEEVLDHPMTDVLRTVNSYMNQFYLMELTDLYQELCGNAYWLIVKDNLGTPRELWPIPPDRLLVVPDKANFIKGYKFQGHQFDDVMIPEDEVVHFKFTSPTSLYYGSSPLSATTDSYNIAQSMNQYELAIFRNMGKVEGAFETEQELSQHEFDRLKEELAQSFRGLENTGKSPLLEKGVSFKNYGALPRELSYLSGRSKIKEETCNAYGQSLALWDKDATRANATVANENFMRDAIRPRLIRMEEKLNEKLTPQFDSTLFVAFDDPVPVDKDFRLKERESNLKTGYSNINMEREQDNRQPVEWGESPILNRTLVPLDSDERDDESDEPSEEDMSSLLIEGLGDLSNQLADVVMERMSA